MNFEEECQSLELFCIVLQHSFSHDAEAGGNILLPLDVALHNGLHSLLQQLVHSRDVVYQIGDVSTPLWEAQLTATTYYPTKKKKKIQLSCWSYV